MDNYILHTRSQNGVIEYFDSLDEALEEFLSYEGYRLGFDIDGKTIYLYRDELPVDKNLKPDSIGYENMSQNIEYEAKIVVQRKDKKYDAN